MYGSRCRLFLGTVMALAIITGTVWNVEARQSPSDAPSIPLPVVAQKQQPKWIPRLSAPDAATRKAAIREAAAHRDQVGEGVLTYMMVLRYNDPDLAVREATWAAFPNLFTEASLRGAWERFDAPDPMQRRIAIQGLHSGITLGTPSGIHVESFAGPLAVSLRKLLTKALSDPDATVQAAAVHPTWYLENDDRMALLGRALNSDFAEVRRETLDVLTNVAGGAWSTGVPTLYLSKPEVVQGATALLPGLIRIVRQDRDAGRAARFLSAIGKPARVALPDLCAALVTKNDIGDFTLRADLAWNIRELCGGPDATAPALAALLRDRRTEVRASAAATFGYLPDFLSSRVEKQPDGTYDRPQEDRILHTGFLNEVPAMAQALGDKEPSARLAAVRSIGKLASFSMSSTRWRAACWDVAVSPLGRTLGDKDRNVVREAAKTLALLPAPLATVVPDLRRALSSSDEETLNYVTVALAHAVCLDRASVWESWRADMTAKDLTRRRRAAQEGKTIAPLLAGSYAWRMILLPGFEFWSHPVSSWRAPDGSSFNMQAISETERDALVQVLAKGLEDADTTVRLAVAHTVERVALMGEQEKQTRIVEGERIVTLREAVKPLVEKARDAIQNDDPDLAKRLNEIRKHYDHPWIG